MPADGFTFGEVSSDMGDKFGVGEGFKYRTGSFEGGSGFGIYARNYYSTATAVSVTTGDVSNTAAGGAVVSGNTGWKGEEVFTC